MATGKNIRTFYKGKWHNEDVAIMKAADHGSWLGTTVFDGARHFEGVTPDLKEHCLRVNNSAKAMMITPTVLEDEMVEIIKEGLQEYSPNSAVYIRPMYWALEGDELAVVPKSGSTGFAICLEEIPMSDLTATSTLTTTSFRRPVLQDNVVNAKAGCLYPNNARMLVEAKSKGFDFLDAPISGGQAGAEGGILTVMVGGDEVPYKKAEPVIDCYSKKIKLLGPSGSGQLTKMVNQICIAGLVQGLSEAINFGMNAGLNMHDVIEVISKGAAQSWQMENRHKTMIEDKFDYGFAVDWMRKDLKIAMDEAKKNNSPLPITKIIDEYYAEVQKMGGQRWDTSSLIKRFRK